MKTFFFRAAPVLISSSHETLFNEIRWICGGAIIVESVRVILPLTVALYAGITSDLGLE